MTALNSKQMVVLVAVHGSGGTTFGDYVMLYTLLTSGILLRWGVQFLADNVPGTAGNRLCARSLTHVRRMIPVS
jgi:hypothetical protein